MAGSVLYIVKSLVDLKSEKEWDKWHSKQHIPDVVKQPGFLKASKFRTSSTEGQSAEYWTIYELENMGAFERYDKSKVAEELRADHRSRFGAVTKTERFVLVKTFETSASREK